MAIYAVIESATGLVENLVEWDGVAAWQPPDGTEAVPATPAAQIGGRYADGQFLPPEEADNA